MGGGGGRKGRRGIFVFIFVCRRRFRDFGVGGLVWFFGEGGDREGNV